MGQGHCLNFFLVFCKCTVVWVWCFVSSRLEASNSSGQWIITLQVFLLYMYFLLNTNFPCNLLLVVSLNDLLICLVVAFLRIILAVKLIFQVYLLDVIIWQMPLRITCIGMYNLLSCILNTVWTSILNSNVHNLALRSVLDNARLCIETMSF